MVDNDTLQAGEYGGWLGVKYDPIVMRPPGGDPFGGVSRTLGSEVLELGAIDLPRAGSRNQLLASLEQPISQARDFENFHHFRALAGDILLGSAVKNAYDLDKDHLERVRRAIADERTGAELEAIAEGMRKQGVRLEGDALKTAPRGYDKDHPRIHLLRMKSFYGVQEWPVQPWLHTRKAKDRVVKVWRACRPLHDWLNRA